MELLGQSGESVAINTFSQTFFPKRCLSMYSLPAGAKRPVPYRRKHTEECFFILASTIDTSTVAISGVAQRWGRLKPGSQGTWAGIWVALAQFCDFAENPS